MIEISIVVPVFGCPGALHELHKRLVDTLVEMKVSYEIILVDDCDKMGSWERICEICVVDSNVKGIRFTKNYGQGNAITAGVSCARGKWIVTMDCDLQDLPETIPQLYARVNEGYDVVFARRKDRKDKKCVLMWGRLFHKIFAKLSEVDYDFELATFLISSRRATDMFIRSKDRGRDFGMYLMWLGYKHSFIDMEQGERHSGKSSYTFYRKLRYALGTITTFSNKALYIPIHFGTFSVVGSIVYLIYVLYTYFARGINPEGWTTIVVSIFFFGGLILGTLGLIGIYLGNIFDMNKDRPMYVVQETRNFRDLNET